MCYHHNMKINEYFKKQYLTVGNTYDNYIFRNCPNDFLISAEEFLSKSTNGVKPCNIKIGRVEQEKIERVLLNCEYFWQETTIASYYITTLIMAELFKGIDEKQYLSLQSQLQNFKENDFKQIMQNYLGDCFMPFDVAEQSKKLGRKIELNIFLFNMDDLALQQAINTFVSCREPYSVKIFTNNERLTTYYDERGDLIQSPHDYINIDVKKFITIENNMQKEM